VQSAAIIWFPFEECFCQPYNNQKAEALSAATICSNPYCVNSLDKTIGVMIAK